MTQSSDTSEGGFTITNDRGEQAFGFSTEKPPVLHGGRVLPKTDRGGPDPASYLIFNDENGDERGGLIASSEATYLKLDYTNCDAVSLHADTSGDEKTAGLRVRSMPDPSLPIEDAWRSSATAAHIGWSSTRGSCITMHDSTGQPRIVLSVDTDDVPHIQVLDSAGQVVRDLF